MEAIAQHIDNKKTTLRHAYTKYGASFVLALMWLGFFLLHTILLLSTGNDSENIAGVGEYVLIVYSLIILWYEIFKLHFKRLRNHNKQVELLAVYLICIVIWYLVIQSGLTKLLLLTTVLLSVFRVYRASVK